MRSHWIEYQGKPIFYCDYTNISLADFDTLRAELKEVEAELAKYPQGTVLGLSDIRGSVASTQVVDLFKKSAANTAKYIRRQAVVGVTGLKAVFFDVIVHLSGQNAKTFDDLGQAKEWLIQK